MGFRLVPLSPNYRWPWMTLNGVMAIILRYFAEFGSFRGQLLRKSGWLAISRFSPEKCQSTPTKHDGRAVLFAVTKLLVFDLLLTRTACIAFRSTWWWRDWRATCWTWYCQVWKVDWMSESQDFSSLRFAMYIASRLLWLRKQPSI